MKKLTKKLDMSFGFVKDEIFRLTDNKTDFFYSHNKNGRFAVLRTTLYDSREPDGATDKIGIAFVGILADSILNVIDKKLVIVGHNPTEGRISHYNLSIAFTTDNLLNAVKSAKKHNRSYVIDLRSGKLLKANG